MMAKKRVSKSERACVALYRAVGKYVEATGGKALIATGVQVQQWPNAKAGEFIIGVKCMGRMPNIPDEKGTI
jgi:hypothetical protein